MAESDWELGSGFAWDGCTGTISEVEFTHDNKLGPNACAVFTFTDVVDADGEAAEDFEQRFTVSKNYDNNKDGSALVGNGKINDNCNFGRLLKSIKDIFTDGDGDVDVPAMMEAVENPKLAECWLGTRWTVESVTVQTTNPTTGTVRDDAKKPVFTAFHGRPEADEAPAKPAAKKAAAPAKKAAAKPAAKPSGGGDIDPELYEALLELAREHEDEDAFQDAALELPAVEALESSDKDAFKAVQRAVMKSTIWNAK